MLGPQACIWSSHVPLQISFLLGQVGLPEPSSLRCEEQVGDELGSSSPEVLLF